MKRVPQRLGRDLSGGFGWSDTLEAVDMVATVGAMQLAGVTAHQTCPRSVQRGAARSTLPTRAKASGCRRAALRPRLATEL